MATETMARPTLAGVASYFGTFLDTVEPSQPWQAGAWTVATNGVMLLARKGESASPLPPDKYRAPIERFLSSAFTPVPAQMADLLTFAGEPFTGAPCDSCGGTGRDAFVAGVTCEHCGDVTQPECSYCGGDGQESLPWTCAYVLGVPINLSYLAYGLAAMTPCGQVAVGTIGKDGRRAVVIESETERFVLQQMRDTHSDSAPRWEAIR